MATDSTPTSRNFLFKVVLLGEGCVGKTSLVLRYVENKFNDLHISTLQSLSNRVQCWRCRVAESGQSGDRIQNHASSPLASYLNKKLNINGKRVNLAIWDTAGQERFHALGPIYYRDSNGAILVYDITDEDSFQKVKNWVKELKKVLGADICLCIAGNKTDLEKQRTVPLEDAENYAASVGAKHFFTSAKINKGIEEMFLDLAQRMIDVAQTNDEERATTLNRTSSRRNVLTIGDEPTTTQKSGCCS